MIWCWTILKLENIHAYIGVQFNTLYYSLFIYKISLELFVEHVRWVNINVKVSSKVKKFDKKCNLICTSYTHYWMHNNYISVEWIVIYLTNKYDIVYNICNANRVSIFLINMSNYYYAPNPNYVLQLPRRNACVSNLSYIPPGRYAGVKISLSVLTTEHKTRVFRDYWPLIYVCSINSTWETMQFIYYILPDQYWKVFCSVVLFNIFFYLLVCSDWLMMLFVFVFFNLNIVCIIYCSCS